MDEKILIDFQLSKGNELEFKRHFLKIKGKLSSDVVSSQVWSPVTIDPLTQGFPGDLSSAMWKLARPAVGPEDISLVNQTVYSLHSFCIHVISMSSLK